MKKLFEIFKNNEDRLIHKWIHYFDIYERYFNSFVEKPINLLEIGVQNGGSLQMWKKYFGDSAKIIGIDIDDKCFFEEENIHVEIGDQSDTNFLKTINEKYGPFDIIIDDGSHIQNDILTSFSFLYPLLKRGGIYLIEDVHTAYFKEYGGGINSNNIVDIFKESIHDVNINYSKMNPKIQDLGSISFYDSIIVFEKRLSKDKFVMSSSKEKIEIQNGFEFLGMFLLD